MSHERNDAGRPTPPQPSEVDRRTFIQGLGAAGVLGGVGAGPTSFGATGAAAQAASQPQAPTGPAELPRPAGLRPGAQADCRFPVSYQQTIPQAVRLVTDYFAAWSEQNLKGLTDVLHFPFAIFEQTDPIAFKTPDEFASNPPMTLAPAGRAVKHPGHYTGRIAPGSYNLLHSIDVPLFCPVGAVVALTFARYSESGHKMIECDGIYTVTNNDGRWGIELVSTIMKPVEYLGVPQADAEMTALRTGQDGMLEYTNRHVPAPAPDPEDRFLGKRASVSFGYGPRQRSGNARGNDQMAGWRIKGVKSRLQLSEVTAQSGQQTRAGVQDPDPLYPRFTRSYNFAQFAEWAGGNVGTWGDTFSSPYTPRVLANGRHADRHKAHTMGGYIRYTPDMVMISETRSVSVRVYRERQWGNAGGIGQVTYHDRSNSYAAPTR